MKKKLWIYFTLALLVLFTACNTDNTQESDSSVESTPSEFDESQVSVSEEENVQPIKVAEGLMDIGEMLFPGHSKPLAGRLLPDSRLLVWSDEGSVLYDYLSGKILHRSPLSIRPLGLEHFYSWQQDGGDHYTVTLYDIDLNVMVGHESDQPAFPAIDGKTLLYDQRQIRTVNAETGAVTEFALRDIDTEYSGGIWVYSFDGEWVFFGATCNPMPGTEGIGAYNVLTGEAVFRGDFPFPFTGIPECFGENNALFWQDGSAHGTDGTYCMVLDTSTSWFRKIDVGENACRMSNNGLYLAAVYSEWNPEASQIRLTRINVFDGVFLEPLAGQHFDLPIGSDYGGSFGGISVSDDGKYVCFSGLIEENGKRRQSLFLYEAEGDFAQHSPEEVSAKKERILSSVQSLLRDYQNGTVDTVPLPNSEPSFAEMPEDFIIPEITSYQQLELIYMAEMGSHAVNIESADGKWLMGIGLNTVTYQDANGVVEGDGTPISTSFLPLQSSAPLSMPESSVPDSTTPPSAAEARTTTVPPQREYAPVYIPKTSLPDPSIKPNPEADVIGVLVYNGNVYHQNVEPGTHEQTAQHQNLLGESVGRPVPFDHYHNLFEQGEIASPGDFYAKYPLSANFAYDDICTVKGYDSDFRLMVRTSYRPMLFERVEDMWVSTGADLLGKAKVRGNIRLAEQGFPPYGPVDLSAPVLEAFVTALYEAPAFIPEDRATLNQTPHANLNLVLNDGTVADLRLYEGGLVSSGLYFRICFQMQLEDFDPIYQALEHV